MTRAMQPEDEEMHDFERRLFESARADSPLPGATERAWLKFAAAAGSLTPLVAAPVPIPWFQGARAQALKWTLIGAIGGGSLVAVWLRPASAPPVLRAPAGVAAPASAALASAPADGTSVASTLAANAPSASTPSANAPSASTPSASTPSASTPSASTPSASVAERPAAVGSPLVRARHRERAVAPSPVPAPKAGAAARTARAASLLAREVAALDAARSALAVGANASALRQIAQYRRDFSDGELSAEADVVAIEALAAAGDHIASRRAAQAFLARHPHDPHVARVRELERSER
ncbi:MAG: hypothetical protein ABI895_08255 [Deltaproteobacteria bacterium]